jgi:hypothetical protein
MNREHLSLLVHEVNSVPQTPLEIGVHPQRLDNGSRMSGDVHVRFCERLGVKLPRPTYPQTSNSLKLPQTPNNGVVKR